VYVTKMRYVNKLFHLIMSTSMSIDHPDHPLQALLQGNYDYNMSQFYYGETYRTAASIKAGNETVTPPSEMSCTLCKKSVPVSNVRRYHSREYLHRLPHYFPSFSNALAAILCGIVVVRVKSGIGKARMEGFVDRVIKRNVQKSRYITDTSVSALISF
jgi:hypothetical protein